MARFPCALGVLCFSPCLTGCASFGPPDVDVTHVRITERTEDGELLLITLHARNPNDQLLPLRDITYRLEADGRRVFTGRRSAEATVGRNAVQTISLPAAIPIDQAVSPGSPFSVSGQITYLSPGPLAEVLFDVGLLRPTVGFRGSGIVEAADTP